MNCLIVYAHPNSKSFNAAIRETLENELKAKGHEVRTRDLYQIGFNPVLTANDFIQLQQGNVLYDVKAEQDEIRWADTLIFVYPTWWENMPAILRGYIDRVFSSGFAYTYNDQGPVGLLKDKKAIIFQTAGSSEQDLNAAGLLPAIKKVIDDGIFGFCGIEIIDHVIFGAVPFVSDDERKKMLDRVKEVVDRNF